MNSSYVHLHNEYDDLLISPTPDLSFIELFHVTSQSREN